jgi:hypothetical protein
VKWAWQADRIGFVEMINSGKGQRLRALFEVIEWQGAQK